MLHKLDALIFRGWINLKEMYFAFFQPFLSSFKNNKKNIKKQKELALSLPLDDDQK